MFHFNIGIKTKESHKKFATVQEPAKILAATGQKSVGSITTWKRGKNLTLLCTMSTAGGYIAHCLLSPKK